MLKILCSITWHHFPKSRLLLLNLFDNEVLETTRKLEFLTKEIKTKHTAEIENLKNEHRNPLDHVFVSDKPIPSSSGHYYNDGDMRRALEEERNQNMDGIPTTDTTYFMLENKEI
jgi:hypothetical protein